MQSKNTHAKYLSIINNNIYRYAKDLKAIPYFEDSIQIGLSKTCAELEVRALSECGVRNDSDKGLEKYFDEGLGELHNIDLQLKGLREIVQIYRDGLMKCMLDVDYDK